MVFFAFVIRLLTYALDRYGWEAEQGREIWLISRGRGVGVLLQSGPCIIGVE